MQYITSKFCIKVIMNFLYEITKRCSYMQSILFHC